MNEFRKLISAIDSNDSNQQRTYLAENDDKSYYGTLSVFDFIMNNDDEIMAHLEEKLLHDIDRGADKYTAYTLFVEKAIKRFTEVKGITSFDLTIDDDEPLIELVSQFYSYNPGLHENRESYYEDDAYAIGMSKAKKMYDDDPPLEKRTIKKAHEIADAIKKKEKIKESNDRNAAEAVLAAKNIVDRFQDTVKKLGEIENEDLPALNDSIRDNMDPDMAERFTSAMTDTVRNALEAMRTFREEADMAARILTGDEPPSEFMGTDAPADFEMHDIGKMPPTDSDEFSPDNLDMNLDELNPELSDESVPTDADGEISLDDRFSDEIANLGRPTRF